MRRLRWVILLGVIMSVAPATAQRYDPNYPVCLQRWGQGGGTNIDCSYTSLEQCRATAAGLSAQCSANPYWSQSLQASPGRRRGRASY
jgi:Tfp pilus assembly protein PilV